MENEAPPNGVPGRPSTAAAKAGPLPAPRGEPKARKAASPANGSAARTKKGPELEQEYFERWFEPFGSSLNASFMHDLWERVHQLPAEEEEGNKQAGATWQLVGPTGFSLKNGPASNRWAGRVKDIEVGAGGLRVAAASGGLWEWRDLGGGPVAVPLSDEVTSLRLGSFATNPANANHILLGTGEPRGGARSGTGLWMTGDGGDSWSHVTTMSPEPDAFYKIRYRPNSTTVVHAATNLGYYRSDDMGATWTRYLSCETTDLAIDPNDPDVLYTSCWGIGLLKSIDGGDSWNPLPISGLGGTTVTDIGRTALAVCEDDPNVLYASVAKNSDNTTNGVYKNVTAGTGLWGTVTPDPNFLDTQGWYDNTIGVSPTDCDNVLVGGIALWHSTDGGSSWTQITQFNHADQHVVTWVDGSEVYVGNDGGVNHSTDGGATWSSGANLYPITQYVNIDVCESDHTIVMGGSQDNGLTNTLDGTNWSELVGGDGAGSTIDPYNCELMWGTNGVFGNGGDGWDPGEWAFLRFRFPDGIAVQTINNGIVPGGQWWPEIRIDRRSNFLYTDYQGVVYASPDDGTSWVQLNGTPFSANVISLQPTAYFSTRDQLLYATLNNSTTGNRLKVYDAGLWFDRDGADLPSGFRIRKIAPHPFNPDVAYALMDGIPSALDGKKIYKTTDRGETWTNVTGNLPNIPLGDLMPHPLNPDLLFLGTALGAFRTTNATDPGGPTWERWNAGMPQANIITEMDFATREFLQTGKMYLIAGTYGRSVWKRDMTSEDPLFVATTVASWPEGWSLAALPAPLQPDQRLSDLLPGFNSAFQYTPGQGYASIDEAEQGSGFWLNLSEPSLATFTESPELKKLLLPASWSLLGATAGDVKPSFNPPSALQAMFAFDQANGYVSTEVIRHGESVWVFCNPSCEADVSGAEAAAKQKPPGRDRLEAIITATGEAAPGRVQQSRTALGVDAAHEAVVPAPPTPPVAATTRLYLTRPGTGRPLYGDYRGDLDAATVWTLVVDPNGDDEAARTTTLTWEPDALRALADVPWVLQENRDAQGRVLIEDMRLEDSLRVSDREPQSFTIRPVGVATAVEDPGDRPSRFALEQNYPNPFNPTTTIRYALPEATHVRLTVYDALGREVATLVDGLQQAGHHNVRFDAGRLATGLYLYRIEAGTFSDTRKMLLLR